MRHLILLTAAAIALLGAGCARTSPAPGASQNFEDPYALMAPIGPADTQKLYTNADATARFGGNWFEPQTDCVPDSCRTALRDKETGALEVRREIYVILDVIGGSEEMAKKIFEENARGEPQTLKDIKPLYGLGDQAYFITETSETTNAELKALSVRNGRYEMDILCTTPPARGSINKQNCTETEFVDIAKIAAPRMPR